MAFAEAVALAAAATRFLFTGQEFDANLNLYWYSNGQVQGRWYDPKTGTFITQDPTGFAAGDVNLYRYVGNAPTNATDPLGLEPNGAIGPPSHGGGVRSVVKPHGPNDIPAQLNGRWKVCLVAGAGHAYIRYESLDNPGEIHTIARYQLGYGGTVVPGLQWDNDLQREGGLRDGRYCMHCVTITNPKMYTVNKCGYGWYRNNCTTYARDAWYYQYGQQWYWLPGPDLPGSLKDVMSEGDDLSWSYCP